MSVVNLGEPPDLGEVAYPAYRPWLLDGFYARFCAYCVVHSPVIHIDHYEPRGYAPHRVDDPRNLLLACAACNGRGGKGDYHPLHRARTRVPQDASGHYVLDVRRDDLGRMYEVLPSGRLRARPGATEDRASWNIALLNLDLPAYELTRSEYLETLEAAELLVSELDERGEPAYRTRCEHVLDTLVRYLARRRLFFEVFDVEMSEGLAARIAIVEKGPL